MRRGIFGGVTLIVAAVAVVLLYLSVYIVDPTENTLVLRLGQPIAVQTEPGLYFKVPLVDNAVYIDKRVQDLDSPPLEIIANDQKRLVVDAFGRYRVFDPLLFYQSLGSIPIADQRLNIILNSAVRRVLGDASFIAVVRDARADLMDKISSQVNGEARRLGIDVIDVRIRRADLPDANSQAIYQRMVTERQRQAAEIRAQGDQESRRIRAEADRQATVIVAEANKYSEQTRGDGDAAVNKIFAGAFSRDPEFFDFYRSMQAYQTGFHSDNTRLLLSPDSEFFNYFKNPMGSDKAAPEAGTAPAPTATPPSGPQAAQAQ